MSTDPPAQSGTQRAEDGFIIYSHIGARSSRTSRYTSEAVMTIRPDFRNPDGLMVAPLGIGVLDCVSKNTSVLARSAPVRVDVNLLEPAADVKEVAIRGQVLHHGRSLIVSEATISDGSDPSRMVAYATVTMSVTGPPDQPAAGDDGHPGPAPSPVPHDDRPLWRVFGGIPRPDGGFDIPVLTPAIGYGRLHSGVMKTLAEAACMTVVGRVTGHAGLWTEQLGASLISSGRSGPFSVNPNVMCVKGGSASCRVTVLDHGAGDRLVASLFVRLGVLD
jgi:acyl-coenzyme A thioesterase PaaI-like protein